MHEVRVMWHSQSCGAVVRCQASGTCGAFVSFQVGVDAVCMCLGRALTLRVVSGEARSRELRAVQVLVARRMHANGTFMLDICALHGGSCCGVRGLLGMGGSC